MNTERTEQERDLEEEEKVSSGFVKLAKKRPFFGTIYPKLRDLLLRIFILLRETLRSSRMVRVVGILLLLVLTFCTSPIVCGLTRQVEPKISECYLFDVTEGEKFTVLYEVTRGGLLDIVFDVKFNDNQIHNEKHFSTESPGSFTHIASKDGSFKICFDNTMSRWTAKVVEFDMFVGEHHEFRLNKESPDKLKMSEMLLSEDLKDLEVEADRITSQLDKTVRSQKLLLNREKHHRELSDGNNSRALFMAFFEGSIVLAISVIQVLLVRRMFKNRVSMPI